MKISSLFLTKLALFDITLFEFLAGYVLFWYLVSFKPLLIGHWWQEYLAVWFLVLMGTMWVAKPLLRSWYQKRGG